jgi:predicted  nucleic acid-binding Zn-ribbon protein
MKKAGLLYLYLTLILFTGIVITSCSSQETTQIKTPSSEKMFSFYDNSDGIKTHYQVSFDKKNEISSLYKNGKEIPASEYSDYEDIVFNNLDELNSKNKNHHFYSFNTDRSWDDSSKGKKKIRFFSFDDDSLWTGDLSNLNIPRWNDSVFKIDMHRMKDELAKLKDMKIKFRFDKDKFGHEMEIFRRNLSDMRLNDKIKDIQIDLRSLTDGLKDLTIEMDEIIVEIPDIDSELKDLNRKMSNLDKEMSKVKIELNKLDNFMKDLRKELFKDKIIESEEEDFSLDFNSERMKVNGSEISSGLLSKYKEMYKKHFGKELQGSKRLKIDN